MDFLLDVLSDSRQVSSRKMFGEYCLYYAGRPVGLVCDEQLFLKTSPEVLRLVKDPSYGAPFPGARPHLLVGPDDWDDRTLLNRLVRAVFESLPPPKTAATAQKTPSAKTAKAAKAGTGATAKGVTRIADLPNLGPKSQAMLATAGISTLAQLRKLGAVAAYVQVRSQSPRASLNLLWALEGALSDTPWQVVAREHRTSLLLALEQHGAAAKAAKAGQRSTP